MRWWWAVGPLLLVAITSCRPGSAGMRYGEFTQPAGSGTVYVDVRCHWTEPVGVDGPRERWRHLGVLAVDLDTATVRYEAGRSFSPFRRYDALGREFFAEYVEGGDDEPLRVAMKMRDASGKTTVLRTETGGIENVTATTRERTTWVCYLRTENVGTTGKRSGEWAVARVNTETREATYLPFPPCGPEGSWDWLTMQDEDVVFLTGRRRGEPVRTWRGDFAKKEWAAPIQGDFAVIDSEGTLIERRDPVRSRDRSLLPTQVEIIRKGVRKRIDLGLPGRVQPLFGWDRVVLRDPASGRYVLRSLIGEPDRWLPATPPADGSVLLHER